MREAAAAGTAGAEAAAPPVRALMQVEARAVAEALAALVADVEGLARVGTPVRAKVHGPRTTLTALEAAEAAVAAVRALVPQQHRTVAEALATLAARVRPPGR